MSKIITTIEGVKVTEEENGTVHWQTLARIDNDGSGGNADGDKFHQSDTTLHHDGKALNAQKVPFIVVPPQVRNGVKGIVMGCQAKVTNTRNGKSCAAVVGDVGPKARIGELSCEAARRIGLSGNANTGGTDEHIILYEITPGTPAVVDGVTYQLQPA